jgi:hypothetical protein
MITSVSNRRPCHLNCSLTVIQIWFLRMSRNCTILRECLRDGDADISCSDYSGGQTKLKKILLNGNNICMVGLLHGFELLNINV